MDIKKSVEKSIGQLIGANIPNGNAFIIEACRLIIKDKNIENSSSLNAAKRFVKEHLSFND